jgi:hypothetical protein
VSCGPSERRRNLLGASARSLLSPRRVGAPGLSSHQWLRALRVEHAACVEAGGFLSLQYVTVYDNHDRGGFAGSKPVSSPETFRCGFSKAQGAAATEEG